MLSTVESTHTSLERTFTRLLDNGEPVLEGPHIVENAPVDADETITTTAVETGVQEPRPIPLSSKDMSSTHHVQPYSIREGLPSREVSSANSYSIIQIIHSKIDYQGHGLVTKDPITSTEEDRRRLRNQNERRGARARHARQ